MRWWLAGLLSLLFAADALAQDPRGTDILTGLPLRSGQRGPDIVNAPHAPLQPGRATIDLPIIVAPQIGIGPPGYGAREYGASPYGSRPPAPLRAESFRERNRDRPVRQPRPFDQFRPPR